MQRFILILLQIFIYSFSYSQHEGDEYIIGSNLGLPLPLVMHLDFSQLHLQIEGHSDELLQIDGTFASICDKNGDVILSTNGMEIFGKHAIVIEDTIASDLKPTGYWAYFHDSQYGSSGFPEHNAALILPVPDKLNEFSIVYQFKEPHEIWGFATTKYLEARVRMDQDTNYTLIYKDSLIEPYHKWFTGPVIGIRHANGRDWWVVMSEADGSKYYSHLLDPTGIHFDHIGSLDTIVPEGLGQAFFSSQGNFMARVDATTIEEGQFITLCSFDRCTGDFNRIGTFHTEAGYFTGVSFSPSERYLYADDNYHLWQWDLLANDIKGSQTLVDTFDGFVQPGWLVMRFGPMFDPPDGRIYIVPPAGSSNYLHVINRPDAPAPDCNFFQHSINLQNPNDRTAPNIVNYRLGPVDGSICDTLGIDNLPVALWRYEEKEAGFPHVILFTDLSYFNPEVWHWDFDDGNTSAERSPEHTFESGLYHVCLTVSNENASDSSCHWVEILETGTNENNEHSVPDLSISPNPFHDKLTIHSTSGTFRSTHVQIYDMYGRSVFDQAAVPMPVSLTIPSLSPGMYLCTIQEDDGTMYGFKVMKQ